MILSFVVAAALAADPSVNAEVPPLEVVKQANASLDEVLGAKERSVEKVAAVVDRYVDFGELTRRALAEAWGSLTRSQREELSRTLRELLRMGYAQRAVVQGRIALKYGDQTLRADEAEVLAVASVADEQVPVAYRLFRTAGGHWRIYDLVTDDISLVDAYRSQFRRVIAEKGYAGLLATLREKRQALNKRPAHARASN